VNLFVSALKIIRLVHLYLGVFIAPAIFFFAFTGALQTFSLHGAVKNGSYKPANWIAVLAQLHKKQTAELPPRKDPAMKDSSLDPETQKKRDSAPKRNTLPMKIFFLAVSLGLSLSTITGLYMSYMYCRSKVGVTAVLLAGVVIPVALAMAY
jgi:hypothetical protein